MGLLGISMGFLAALSFWSAWRDPDWRAIGAMLIIGWASSNATVYYASVDARPAIYTSIEIVVALLAMIAAHGRFHRAAFVVLIATFVSVYCNLYLAFHVKKQWIDIHNHEVRTNITFVVECLLTIGVGMRQRGHIGNWFGFNRPVDTADNFASEANGK